MHRQNTAYQITGGPSANDGEILYGGNEKYRYILESIQEAYFEADLAGNLTFFNNSLCRLTGYTRKELTGLNYKQFSDKKNSRNIFQTFNKVHRTGEPAEVTGWLITRKDGSKRYIDACVSLNNDLSGNTSGFNGVIRDVTERKLAESVIKRSEANYRDIFVNAIEGIYQSTVNGSLITVNDAFARMAGYSSPAELMESVLDIKTQLYVNPQDSARFMEIMTGKGFVNGFEVEFYKKDGSTFWAVLYVRAVTDKKGRVLFFEGFMEDITLRKRAEEKLHQTLQSLRRAFGATIKVMVSAVELRDPYTAGHQARTAEIACAIAEEMKLSRDKIEGIKMAGIVHDIGKLAVPVEILSKPTKLTNTEFSLIKEHPRVGYEILKDIEYPWPLAEIVYQHHERMDGSGYPRSLMGNEIIIEARIMGVADVVEAMASDRPYRAALGLDTALAEIEKNKGGLYDEDVVNACIRLFREKGYCLT